MSAGKQYPITYFYTRVAVSEGQECSWERHFVRGTVARIVVGLILYKIAGLPVNFFFMKPPTIAAHSRFKYRPHPPEVRSVQRVIRFLQEMLIASEWGEGVSQLGRTVRGFIMADHDACCRTQDGFCEFSKPEQAPAPPTPEKIRLDSPKKTPQKTASRRSDDAVMSRSCRSDVAVMSQKMTQNLPFDVADNTIQAVDKNTDTGNGSAVHFSKNRPEVSEVSDVSEGYEVLEGFEVGAKPTATDPDSFTKGTKTKTAGRESQTPTVSILETDWTWEKISDGLFDESTLQGYGIVNGAEDWLRECVNKSIHSRRKNPLVNRRVLGGIMGHAMRLLQKEYEVNAPTGWQAAIKTLEPGGDIEWLKDYRADDLAVDDPTPDPTADLPATHSVLTEHDKQNIDYWLQSWKTQPTAESSKVFAGRLNVPAEIVLEYLKAKQTVCKP